MNNQKRNLELIRNNVFGNAMGITLEMLEEDRAAFRLEIGTNHKTPYGSLHGGAFYTMADAAAGAAARTDGRDYVTQSGGLNFLRGQREGQVRAEAVVRHRGRRICLVEVTLTDGEGKLLATGTLSFFCVSADSK